VLIFKLHVRKGPGARERSGPDHVAIGPSYLPGGT
jgi:hypothetical protein